MGFHGPLSLATGDGIWISIHIYFRQRLPMAERSMFLPVQQLDVSEECRDER